MAVEAENRVVVRGADGTPVWETWIEAEGRREVLVMRPTGVDPADAVRIGLDDLSKVLQEHAVTLPGWVRVYA